MGFAVMVKAEPDPVGPRGRWRPERRLTGRNRISISQVVDQAERLQTFLSTNRLSDSVKLLLNLVFKMCP